MTCSEAGSPPLPSSQSSTAPCLSDETKRALVEGIRKKTWRRESNACYLCAMYQTSQIRAQQPFLCKGPDVSVSGFISWALCGSSTLLLWSKDSHRRYVNNTYVNTYHCVPTKLHLRTLKFARHTVFMVCETLLFFLLSQTLKNVKTLLGLRAIQNQPAHQVPQGNSLPTPDGEGSGP